VRIDPSTLIRLNAQFRVLHFLLVGGANTALSYGLYALLTFAGLNYATAGLGSLLVGVLLSFKAQGALVFGNTDNRLLWRFALCWLAIYLLYVLLIGKFIALGIDRFAAGLLPIPCTMTLSYFAQRFLVFGSPGSVALSPLPRRFVR